MWKRTFVIFLLVIAAAVRLYRIADSTEFLGDQGSAGMVIYHALQERSVPLVGPVISTGQRPGPFFYYLSAVPLIMFRFNPVAPAVLMALLGVAATLLVYHIGSKVLTPTAAQGVAVLYALSPAIVIQDRTFWNPTPIPFLVLVQIAAMYYVAAERKYAYMLLLGVAAGISVQLHYTSLFHVLVAIIFGMYVIVSSRSTGRIRSVIAWSLAGVFGFLFVLSPFLYYEAIHGFSDLKELVLLFLYPGAGSQSNVPVWQTWGETVLRLFRNVTVLPASAVAIVASASILAAFLKRSRRILFLNLWFLAGIGCIGLYKGTIFDHYLSFLLPFPFFLFGSLLTTREKRVPRWSLSLLFACLAVFSLTAFIRSATGYGDIRRTQTATDEIIRQAEERPFSFALISSRSFSDLHYRYFFLIRQTEPQPLETGVYDTLFLVCETESCPTSGELEQQHAVPVVCFDYYCGTREYPKLDMTGWMFIRSTDENGARIYTFSRTMGDVHATR